MKRFVIIFSLVLAMLVLFCGKQEKQQPASTEKAATSLTPKAALKAMHEVIHPMWHDAYPEKDVEQLKSLYPELQKQYQALKSVQFPDSLRDKSMHWQQGVEKMGQILQEYGAAIEKNDTEALLNAARDLHTSFEKLVGILKPAVPALDEFHKVLFKVFHDYIPNNQWDKVKETIPEFQEKMKAVEAVTLPAKLAEHQAAFDAARKELAAAVEALAKTDVSNQEQLQAALDRVHEAFKEMEEVLE